MAYLNSMQVSHCQEKSSLLGSTHFRCNQDLERRIHRLSHLLMKQNLMFGILNFEDSEAVTQLISLASTNQKLCMLLGMQLYLLRRIIQTKLQSTAMENTNENLEPFRSFPASCNQSPINKTERASV